MQVAAVAENGIEALEKIKEVHPDIAIIDIRMPGLSFCGNSIPGDAGDLRAVR